MVSDNLRACLDFFFYLIVAPKKYGFEGYIALDDNLGLLFGIAAFGNFERYGAVLAVGIFIYTVGIEQVTSIVIVFDSWFARMPKMYSISSAIGGRPVQPTKSLRAMKPGAASSGA